MIIIKKQGHWKKGNNWENSLTLMVVIRVFDVTFNDISALLVEETGVSGENHRPASSQWHLSHNVVLSTPFHERDSNSLLVVIDWFIHSFIHLLR